MFRRNLKFLCVKEKYEQERTQIYSSENNHDEMLYVVYQAWTIHGTRVACGPSEFFLRPARAFSIGENVAKACFADTVINCRSRISSKLQRNEIE